MLLVFVVNIYGLFLWKIRKVLQLLTKSRKPNKIWVNKGNECYNRSMKSWLQDNDMEMYSTRSEAKFVAERFNRTLKNKIYKYMTSVSKALYNGNLANIVNTP